MNDLMTRKQAAEYLGMSPATLAQWASTKKYDLPYYKIGIMVRYKKSDLDAFLKKQVKESTDK